MFKTKVSKVKVLNLQGGFFYGVLFCFLFGFMFLIYHIEPRSPHTPLFLASLIFYFLCIIFMEIALVGELCALQQEQIDELTRDLHNMRQEIQKLQGLRPSDKS